MDGCITQISRSGEKENVYKGRLYGFHERATGKRAVIQMEDVTAPKRRPPRPENKAEFENALKKLGKGIMSYIYLFAVVVLKHGTRTRDKEQGQGPGTRTKGPALMVVEICMVVIRNTGSI